MTIITQSTQTAIPKHLESILVVKREHLFHDGDWHGLKPVDFDHYLALITKHQEFQPRGIMETNPRYKQIIPYLIFRHNGSYFLMERHAKASEQRLKSKLSLGIGGHIRKEDMNESSIFDWARREFHEEVAYTGKLEIKPLGILNDDSNEVGRVHIGFVFLLEGNSPHIAIKSELQSGSLVSLDECKLLQDRMETWSQMALTYLE